MDTTGAGDSFAGAFLYFLNHGSTPEVAAKKASIFAAEVVSRKGPRLGGDYKEILSDLNLLEG